MAVVGVSTGGEVRWGRILKIRNWKHFCFACRATTGDDMAKWRLQLDLAHQKGLETSLHEISDCSGDTSTGGEVCWGGILKIGQTFLLMEPQPVMLRQNGWHSWIRLVKLV